MTDLLTPIETRLDAILTGGRGEDGSLGADVLARAIPSGRYRRSTQGASLRDVSYPLNVFDRAYALEWGAQGPVTERHNQSCSRVPVRIELALLLGHVYGAAHAQFVRTIAGEDAATVVLRPRVRGNGDVFRIQRALCFGRMHGNDTEPPIIAIEQSGPTTIEDLGDRILTTVPFVVVLNASNTEAYAP